MSQYDIAVLGSMNMDIFVQVKDFPKNGENSFCEGIFPAPGGKGNNQAVSAAKFGKKVTMIGCIGNDSAGKQLKENLENRNIDTSNLLILDDIITSSCCAIIDKNGDNTLLVNMTANLALSEAHVTNVFNKIDVKALLVQMETSKESILAGLKAAKKKGIFTIIDPAPVNGIDEQYFHYADLIVPNSNETKFITNIEPTDEASALEAAKIIADKGVKNVIVKMGQNGCLLYQKGHSQFYPSMKVKAVDTVGAGDCFAGALASHFIEHDDLDAAIKFAHIAAGFKVSRFGGHDAIPTLAEINSVLTKYTELSYV
ncbi:PfkB family carbohydrate kinase [Bartonella tamiae]|uniref:Ribokinase n=1 Tax=Bartonella tamiae Th239 TaxID=1094558 RepID=J1JZA5_9HYPH|nr:PfkB family carbohydrate kinase [Bartonella tamiae]EJF90432.1 ribokinase [Bartonella tamiae Th239]EJF93624.1 ribokinase [Bartonella tamiae Th307]